MILPLPAFCPREILPEPSDKSVKPEFDPDAVWMVALELFPSVTDVPLTVNPPVPLNKYVGLLLPPKVIAFALEPIPNEFAPLVSIVNPPAAVGWIDEPMVISAPDAATLMPLARVKPPLLNIVLSLRVNVLRLLVPPVKVNPEALCVA